MKTVHLTERIKTTIEKIPIFGQIAHSLWNLLHINRMKQQIYNMQYAIQVAEQRLAEAEHRLDSSEQRLDISEQRMGSAEKRLDASEQRMGSAEKRLDVSEQRMGSVEKSVAEIVLSSEQNVKKLFASIRSLSDDKRIDEIRNQRSKTKNMGVSNINYDYPNSISRDEKKERYKAYEDVIKKVKSSHVDQPVALDLGCGNGEWIDLLQSQYDYYSLGIDLDKSVLNNCRAKGLNVVRADLTSFLHYAQNNSMDLISLFNVAEYLSIDALISTLKECNRLLRVGGALIIETLNPENLYVGACGFYLDPRRVTKLPPLLLKMLAEKTGMKDSEIIQLSAHDIIQTSCSSVKSGNVDIDNKLNKYLYDVAADYALVAYK